MSQQQLLHRPVPLHHRPPLLWPLLPRPIPVGPALPRPVLRRPLLPQLLQLRPKTLCAVTARVQSLLLSFADRTRHPRVMESEVVVLVSEARGRKISLSTAHPRQKQKRSQQTETLTRVRADKSVAASADGEQPLAGPLIIAAVIGHPLGRWWEPCA